MTDDNDGEPRPPRRATSTHPFGSRRSATSTKRRHRQRDQRDRDGKHRGGRDLIDAS